MRMLREGKLFSNTLLLGVFSVLSKMLTFLMLPLYTAALSPAEFGVVDVLVTTAVLLIPIISLHAPEAVFRFRTQGENGAFWAGVLFVGIGLSLLTLLVPLLSLSAFLAPYVGLLYAYVTASVLRSFFAHTLRADGAFFLYSVQQLFCAAITTILQVLFLVVWRRGITGYLLAVILGDGVTFAILLFCQLTRWRDHPPTPKLCKRMLRYSLPLIPTAALWWAISASDRYILLAYCGEALTGLYAAAGRLPALLGFAVGVFLEAFHYAALRCDKKERCALFGRIYALLVPMLVLCCAFMTVAAGALVRLLLSRGYEQAEAFVPLLTLGALCAGLSNFMDSVYSLHYASMASLLSAFAAALANVALNFLLIPHLGGIGAALATVISFAALLVLRLWHTRRYLSFPRLWLPLFLSIFLLLASGVCYGVGWQISGGLLALLSVIPLIAQIRAALAFLLRRGGAFLQAFVKEKKTSKKI